MSLEYLNGTDLESIPNPIRKDYLDYMRWIQAKEDHRKLIQKRSVTRRKDALDYIEGLKQVMHHPDLIELKKVVLRHSQLFSLTAIHEICKKIDEVCGE